MKKKVWLIAAGIFASLVLAVSLFLIFFPATSIARSAAQRVSEKTNWNISLQKASVSWKLALTIQGLEILSPSSTRPVKIEKIELFPHPFSLFSRNPEILYFAVQNADVPEEFLESLLAKKKGPGNGLYSLPVPRNLALQKIRILSRENGTAEEWNVSISRREKKSSPGTVSVRHASSSGNARLNLSGIIPDNAAGYREFHPEKAEIILQSYTPPLKWIGKKSPVSRISGTIRAQRSGHDWKLSPEKLSFLFRDKNVSIDSADLLFHEESQELTGTLSGNSGGVQFKVDPLMANRFGVETAGIAVSGELSPLLKNSSYSISGKFLGNIAVKKNRVAFGSLTASSLVLSVPTHEILRAPVVGISLVGSEWEISQTPLQLFGTQVNIQGMFSLQSKRIALRVSGKNVDLRHILQSLRNLPSGSGKSSVAGTVELRFETADIYGLSAESLVSSVSIDAEKISLQNISLRMSGGKWTGMYSLSRGIQKTHAYSASFSGVDSVALFRELNQKPPFTGRLSGESRGVFSGTSPNEFLNTLKASLSVKTGAGRISDSFLQRGALNGPLAPMEKAMANMEFDDSYIDLTTDSGKVKVQKAFFHGANLRLSFLGYASFTGEGEGNLKVQFNDALIAGIANPAHLGIQEQKMGEFYHLSFSCHGNMKKSSCWSADW